MEESSVIAIGLENSPGCAEVLSEIQHLGLALRAAEDRHELNDLIRRRTRAAVVIYRGKDRRLVEEILTLLSDRGRRPPVVVLVDESDFADYYKLMEAGASDYYALSEGPEVIARAVRQAAGRA